MLKECSVEGCGNKSQVRKMCIKHYARFRRYGDVNFVCRIRQFSIELFWSFVDKTETCWIWRGQQNEQGYGTVNFNRQHLLAHRYAYFLHYGKYPINLCLHHCDVPSCVNPEHLYDGTHQDNSDDMAKRKRNKQCKGSLHGNAKLTELEVRFIKYWTKSFSQTLVSQIFQVTHSCVNRIHHGKSWQHIQ